MTAAKKLVDDKLLKTLVPFGELKDEQFARLSGQYKVETFEPGKTLFRQGERDARTYFLLAGQVSLRYSDGSVKSIIADTPQAQYAMVPVRPRQATATAKTPVTVLSLDANLFDDILTWGNENGFHVSELDTHDDENDWMTCFLQSKVFLRLPAQNIQALMMRLEEVKVKAGHVVIRQGDDDGYYYIIKSGRCRVSRKHSPKDKELELATLNVGEGFGEEAIITHNRRGASVTMLENGSLMRLSRNDFNRLLVEPLISAVSYSEVASDPRAVFLDVRNYEDYARDGITHSKNITLTELRLKIDQLNSSKQYVVCSNTGSRAAAAAFLLCQQGIDAVVLRYGLENLPADVKRGNGTIEDLEGIPVVDNVVSFNNKEIPTEKAPELPVVKDIANKEPPAPVTADEAMKDPRVKALFSQAQRRLQEENSRAKDADLARKKAQLEVNRLKNEAEQARAQMEEAKRQAEKAAKDSALAARLEAKKDAARLRELELGAKQAELEEAVRQVEEEAHRAKNADLALKQAEQEIDNLKKEMQSAVEHAQEEAQKSAEAIRQFLEQEAKRQKQEAARVAEKEAQRAHQAEEAHRKAQQEIERLKADAQATNERLREQAKLESDRARSQAEQARKEAEEEIERLRKEAELARMEAEEQAAKKHAEALAAKQAEAEAAIQKAMEQVRLEAQAEIEKLRLQADKATDAVKAKKHAEAEIAKVKQQAEQERLRIEEQAIRIAEAARAEAVEEAWKISEAKQSEIEAVSRRAAEEAKRTLEAEEARRRAEQEIERLKQETEAVRNQMQQQLSSEIERSEIEHEVAKARALELANKQAEIEEITKKSEEESSRALSAEDARKKAEEEINNLKREMEALRSQQKHTSGELSGSDSELARAREKALSVKLEEIQQVSIKAAAESAKASAADEARKQAEIEIQRLRSEVKAVTLQAQAQLHADAERAASEQQAMQERSIELEKMQAMIAEAKHRAIQEKERAKQAEHARRESEEQLARLKAAEEANVRAQEEIQRLKAEAGMAYYQAQEQAKHTAKEVRQKAELEIQKARADEASRKQAELEQAARMARQETQRAEQAEKARSLAEAEIKKLKAEAKLQRLKAEKAIRESIKSTRDEESEKIKLRAAEKVRKSMGNDTKKTAATPVQIQNRQDDDPLGILDLAQSQNSNVNAAANRRTNPAAGNRANQTANRTANSTRNTVESSLGSHPAPEADAYDFSKEIATEGSSGFISDQLMWETALGMREDKAVTQIAEPQQSAPHASVAPAHVAHVPKQHVASQQLMSGQNAAQYLAPNSSNSAAANTDSNVRQDQAVFRAKDVNPYVNTQDVTGIVKHHKHGRSGGIFKYLMVGMSLCMFAAAGYYFTLNNSQREQRREQIKSFIANEIPLPKTAETTAPAGYNVDNASSAQNTVSPAVNSASANKPQRPLTMEERLELKREKAIEGIMERKKSLERKVDNQASEPVVSKSSPAVLPTRETEAGVLPKLVETNETSNKVDIKVVNPLPESLNTIPANTKPASTSSEITSTESVSSESEAIKTPQFSASSDDTTLQGTDSSAAGIQLLPLNTETEPLNQPASSD